MYANREFFDNFEAIVEDDAKWAYRFQRRFDDELKDRDDIYLEVLDLGGAAKAKGLAAAGSYPSELGYVRRRPT